MALGTTSNFKEEAAEKYQLTYNTLIKGLTSGPLLHVDETRISMKTGNGFVWVFANMQQVVYIYNETREATILHTLLKDFTGVLVSDFYPAYEGVQCSQQKCLIHLIRDLNDDLLKHPFDEELKWLTRAFAELLRPMVETIDRHGLQSRFLKQHLSAVEKFYKRLQKLTPRSEVATKCKQRFEKNRDTLFTFLKHDGVPWNNNNAEHAVKAFATLRHVIKGVTSEAGLRDYLVLLSICETCNYQGLDFLDFLRSGETDIAAFADAQQKKCHWRNPGLLNPGYRRRIDVKEPSSSRTQTLARHNRSGKLEGRAGRIRSRRIVSDGGLGERTEFIGSFNGRTRPEGGATRMGFRSMPTERGL